MASVVMESPVGVVEQLPPEPAAFAANGRYRPLVSGKVSQLHIAEIEAVAEGVAKALEYSPGDDLHLVVEKLGGELGVCNPAVEASRISETLVGSEPGTFRILVPPSSSLPFENVIIAKELGHYFLHHLYSRAKEPAELLAQGDTVDPVALSNSEAEVFALCFLMPRSRFKKDVGQNADLGSLARRYGIPETIVRKRCEILERGTARG
jgi:predicted transcriptional regulator